VNGLAHAVDDVVELTAGFQVNRKRVERIWRREG
jgi:hypothetical protein